MNCHAVQQLLSAERDQALGANARESLEAHLAGCAGCRQMRATLAEAAEAWRTTTAKVRVPDARIEWQRLRRQLSGGTVREAQPARAVFTWWRSATLAAAAAAVAFGVFVGPAWFGGAPASRVAISVAATDSVEVGADATAMVYVDDTSGWLVVWAAGAPDTVGGG